MTEYTFNIRCTTSYISGGKTVWNKGDVYLCKTTDFVFFYVSRDSQEFSGTMSFYELTPQPFLQYFEIDDILSKLPLISDWMDEDTKTELGDNQCFAFIKANINRLCSEFGFSIEEETVCEVAYNLLYGCDISDSQRYYVEYLKEQLNAASNPQKTKRLA